MIHADPDRPVEVEIAGQKYKMTRLTPADFFDLRCFETKRKLQRLKRIYMEDPSVFLGGMDSYDDQVHRIADKEHNVLEDIALVSSKQGAYEAIWLSLRKYHPDMTLPTVQERIPEPEAIALATQMTGFGAVLEEVESNAEADMGNVLPDDAADARNKA